MRARSYRHYGEAMDRGLRQVSIAEPAPVAAAIPMKQYTIDFAKNTITLVKHYWVDPQGNIVDLLAAP